MKTSNLTIYPEEPITVENGKYYYFTMNTGTVVVICINHGYSSHEFFGVVVASPGLEYKLGYMDGFHKQSVKPFKGEFTTTVGEM
jgi:hypothetical protein